MTHKTHAPGIPLRELFDKHPLPMWVFDLETLGFRAVNAAAIRRYGYSRREFLAMTIKEIRPPEDVPALLEKIARPVAGYDAAGIWRHRKKDGTIIDVEIISHTLRFAGRPAKLILAIDVTERGRLGQELQRSADEWRQTFDAMSDAVALIDPDGTITRCNRAMTILTGKGYDEIIGQRCWEIVHGTSDRIPGCPVREMLDTRQRAAATIPLGSRIFRVVADPLFDTSGRFIGAVHIMTDVTQQRHDDKALHDSLLQQQAILNNVPDIAWLKDDQGRFLAVNAPFGRASGFAPADLVGKTDLEIWPRELAERYRADDAEVLRSRLRKVVEEPLADKAGIATWIETIKTPIIDDEGRVIGTTGIARDITARKRTEEALQQKEYLLSEAQRIAHVGSWDFDLVTGKLSWSDELYRVYGRTRETFEPTAENFLQLIHADDRAATREWVRATAAGERTEELQFRVIWPDGSLHHVNGAGCPVFDAAGKPIRMVGTGQDITERTSAEAALRASEEKFRTFFNSANDAIFIVDLKGDFIDANTVASERLGLTREELLSKNVAEIDSPEFAARVPERIAQIMKHGKASFETAHIRKDGTVMPVEINSRVIDYEGRKALYSVVRDISARKQAEAAILEQQAFTEQLIQGSSVATFVINDRHEVVLWNKACEELTGVAAAAILGSAETWRPFYEEPRPVLADLVLDRDRGEPSTFYAVVSRSVLMPEGLHAERWIKGLNGKDRFIVFDAAPIFDVSGKIIAAIETIQDLTSRKRAEERIAESEERYRNLFDNAGDMIQSVTPDGRFLYVNASWRRIMGYDENDLRSLTMFDIIHPSSKTSCEEHFARVMSGEVIDFLEAKFVAKDGRIIDVEGSANVRRVDGKNVSTQGIFRDVTERKLLREEVYRISHDWEETFDTLTDMVTVHDRDFNIIRANKAAEKILGLPFLNTKPVKCFEYFHGTGCPPAGCPSCASLVTGQPSVNEIYEPHLGRQLEIRAIPRLDSAGQVAGLIHVVRDITERTRAEETKKEQMRLAEFGMHIGTALNKEGTLQEILGACTDLLVGDLGAAFARIWTVSSDGKTLILQASSGLYTHRDGPHGRIPLDKDLKIPTIARTRKAHLTNAVIGDPQVDQEWAVREGMVAFAGFPLQVGAHLVGVMGLFARQELSDFTLNALEAVAHNIASGIERILSDIAMQRYGENLAALNTASNELLALASLPKIYEGVCRFAEKVFGVELVWLGLIDAGGSEVTVAGSAGVAKEYLRTLKVRIDDSPAGRGPSVRAIQSKQPRLTHKDAPEFEPWRAAAEKHNLEVLLSVPLIASTEAGTCIGVLNFYSRLADYFNTDRVRLCQIFANQAAVAIENARLISGLEEKVFARTFALEAANIELQHLNKELDLRRIEAESASRSKSDFLANMSHELRTPLNAIIGFSDILIRGMAGPLAEKPKEYLGDILAGGKHLLSLINDILDLSKVEAGKMEIEPAEYDPAGLIDRCLVMFREKAVKHRLDLRAEIEGAIDPIFGDERKIRQVLYNLLSNAVKFTPDGGAVIVRARTVQKEGEDYAEISVADTGIGISSEDQQRLFQPFRQLGHHLTKEQEGTGLGLALCKSFVEMHGGRIGVQSAPGRGSTFTFSIPLHYGKGVS